MISWNNFWRMELLNDTYRCDVRGVCCWWVWLVVRFVCVPLCVRVFRVSRVLEVTQTHIHIHTHTLTPWRVPRGGGLEGRHAHGELEAHGGGGEEYGSCVRENDVCVPAPPGVFLPVRVCRTRLHFADRFRAGAGRRSGSGWRQGRVRWGRPLLSRPRGAVGPGPAAVESAAASVVALTCGPRFRWL